MTLDISQIKWSGDNGTWVLHGTPLVMSNIFHQATQLRKTRVSYSATIQGFHIYHYLSVFVGSGCQQTHRTYDLTTSRHRRSSGLGVLRLSRSASPCEWVMGEDLDSRGCRCRWVGGCFWSGLLMRWMITDVFMIYIYIYDMYDIVYTLIPVFLYFVYVRYRSHLDARRIPSQLSTGSIRQPSELGLVGGGQAGSEAPAGFVWWFLLNDFSLRMVSLRCPYLFFLLNWNLLRCPYLFFLGGYVDWPGKWWLLSCFRAETCWNQHLIMPCSLRQWLDTSQPGALKNAGSVFVSISVIKGQFFFFAPILTNFDRFIRCHLIGGDLLSHLWPTTAVPGWAPRKVCPT